MTRPPSVHTVVDVPIRDDHPAFAGHFPSNPLLPGAAILCEVFEAAHAQEATQRLVTSGCSIEQVKFLAPVGPGTPLRIVFDVVRRPVGEAIDFEVFGDAVLVARGRITGAVAT